MNYEHTAVGEGQPDPMVNTATGVVATVAATGIDSTVDIVDKVPRVAKVTWADIVRTPAAGRVVAKAVSLANTTRGHEASKKCKFVSRSFYRNNSVKRTSRV